MKNNKIITSMVSVGATLLFLASAFPLVASAQVGVSADASVGVNGTGVGATANVSTRLTTIIARGDADIAARITALNNLNTRVQSLKNVSGTEKANILAEVQTNSTGLTTLKSKIDADTAVTTAQTDDKSIFGSFRIYALVIPQGYITASADRIDTVVSLMTNISAKLQARITADQSAGKNVTALQASLTDLNAKIADAHAQAGVAASGVASLVPDQGDQTKLAANTAALKSARATIKVGTQDLQTARTDAKSIMTGLKSLGASTSVSASTTATQ
jgi:hypothetical protein